MNPFFIPHYCGSNSPRAPLSIPFMPRHLLTGSCFATSLFSLVPTLHEWFLPGSWPSLPRWGLTGGDRLFCLLNRTSLGSRAGIGCTLQTQHFPRGPGGRVPVPTAPRAQQVLFCSMRHAVTRHCGASFVLPVFRESRNALVSNMVEGQSQVGMH